MAWTYEISELATSALYRVRMAVGDTNPDDPQLQDEEIDQIILVSASETDAMARAARLLEARYARSVDKWVGDLKILASQRARAYKAVAESFEARSGAVRVPSAGGIRQTEKDAQAADTELVQPYFVRQQHDNTEA